MHFNQIQRYGCIHLTVSKDVSCEKSYNHFSHMKNFNFNFTLWCTIPQNALTIRINRPPKENHCKFKFVSQITKRNLFIRIQYMILVSYCLTDFILICCVPRNRIKFKGISLWPD